jgi:hypothetical protein
LNGLERHVGLTYDALKRPESLPINFFHLVAKSITDLSDNDRAQWLSPAAEHMINNRRDVTFVLRNAFVLQQPLFTEQRAQFVSHLLTACGATTVDDIEPEKLFTIDWHSLVPSFFNDTDRLILPAVWLLQQTARLLVPRYDPALPTGKRSRRSRPRIGPNGQFLMPADVNNNAKRKKLA